MITAEKSAKNATLTQLADLTRRRAVRQFVKFAIVGASSAVINLVALYLMLSLLHGHRFVSATVAFLISVGNGYVWNKRWTFREAQFKAAHTQFTQFLLVNVVGLGLTWLIMFIVAPPMERQLHVLRPLLTHESVYKWASIVAQVIAIPIVSFWNFFANRHWTFKH